MSTSVKRNIESENYFRVIIRYALAVMVPIIITMIFQWELGYICPTLVTILLAPKSRPLSKYQFFLFLLGIVGSSFVGVILIGTIISQPVLSIMLTAWMLFLIFRFQAKGGDVLIVLLWILSVISYPTLASMDVPFAIDNMVGLIFSYIIAIFTSLFFRCVISDVKLSNDISKDYKYNESEVSIFAMQNTLALLPLFVVYILFDFQYAMLTLLYASMLISQGCLNKGMKSLIGLMMANCLGGVAAIVLFELVVIAPISTFYISLVFFFSLVFAYKTFTKGALYSSAFSCFLILLTDVTTTTGHSIDTFFYERILFIAFANLYVLVAFLILFAFKSLKASPRPILE
ncbi:DUF2955 domain-containing protein [Vibrio rotiferianus]|uniref:DUF2955 domain-containing protein n=1 Tax=Vibrio rotiferianus TaxID=190895 RepID=UPI000B59AE32|nr:DUF2955 domain-containing protein [Vibrio rotiferianus]ASI96580.1 hypothetical protein BSZ04_16655 [Vibrio rotiferianus]